MIDVLPFVIGGIVTGSLYALAGLGLVLTYRTSGVFNFGHGAIAAGGAFLFYTLHNEHGWPWPLAVLATLAAFAVVVGPLLELLTRTLVDAPAAISVVVTVGLFLAVDGLLLVSYGDITRQAPPFLPQSGFTVFEVTITWGEVISALLALASAVALYRFLQRSRLGTSMRAVVDNASLVGLTGTQATRVRRVAWMIGSAFAALSGILLAPIIGLDATLLTLLVVQAFGGVGIGLFSSLPMTYVGGLVVGVAAALATDFFTDFPLNQLPPSVPFIILMVVLLVVPTRKLPRSRVNVTSLASTARALPRRVGVALSTGAGVIALLIPAVVGSHLPVWINAMSYVIIFGSLSLLVWTSGQISLCQVSFAALGATTMAHLTEHGVPWLIALALAGAMTVPVGAVIAIPAIRFSGIYLALITFGFGIFMQYVVYPTSWMFGSTLQAHSQRMHLGPIAADTSDTWEYYLSVVVAALCLGALITINRSRFGRLLRGLAESPTMLSTLGLDVNVTRLILFCLSAFFAGVGGGLISSQFTVSALSFNPVYSLSLLAVLGVCGIVGGRLILTAVLAALLYAVLPGYSTGFDADHQLLFFGLAAVVVGLVVANRAPLTSWLRRQAGQFADRIDHSPVTARGRLTPPRLPWRAAASTAAPATAREVPAPEGPAARPRPRPVATTLEDAGVAS